MRKEKAELAALEGIKLINGDVALLKRLAQNFYEEPKKQELSTAQDDLKKMKLVETLARLPIADSQGISASAVESNAEAGATIASSVHVGEPVNGMLLIGVDEDAIIVEGADSLVGLSKKKKKLY